MGDAPSWFGDVAGDTAGDADSDGAGSSRKLFGSVNAARGALDTAGGMGGVDGVYGGAGTLSGASRRAASEVLHAIHAFNASLASDHGAVYPSRLMASDGSLSAATVGLLNDSRVRATMRAMAQDVSANLAADIAAAQATSAARGADTEITIHIGRIDVTALRAPAARPVKAPAASATAMSLDTYLSRRQRSGS